MALFGYRPKTRRAPWTDAFPGQVRPAPRPSRARRGVWALKSHGAGVKARPSPSFNVKVSRSGASHKARRRWGISSQSKHRQKRTAEYSVKAKAFVAAAVARGERCAVVAVVPGLRDGRKYGWSVSDKLVEVHHTRGRLGPLLMDERFWMPISKAGHRWVHANVEQARRHGWLCEPGKWNTPDKLLPLM